MAATINEVTSHSEGGLNFVHIKLTSDSTTAAYTVTGAPQIKMMTQPFKTTGTTGDITAIYDASTGVITLGTVANLDVIRFTIAY